MAAPGWLLGLLLVPLIRWLHRGGAPPSVVPVAHLGLWPAAPTLGGQATRVPPDPSWRRRALLAALLVLALAGPRWPDSRPRVTLWVDDSPAMLLRDADGTRLAAVLALAAAPLDALGDAEVELRALSDPWPALSWPGGAAGRDAASSALGTDLAAAIARRLKGGTTDPPEPAGPPAALLAPERRHWLLTAHAPPARPTWPVVGGPDRVIAVDHPARNAGLVRLSARRARDDPQHIELLAVLANGGAADETRILSIETGVAPAVRIERRVAPDEAATVMLRLPTATVRVHARLEPADALPDDDTLVLALAPLRPRLAVVDAACPPALQAAVAVHPVLAPRATGATASTAGEGPARDAGSPPVPAMVVDCGGDGLPRGVPTLRLRAEALPLLHGDAPRWSTSVPASRRPAIEGGRLALSARLSTAPADGVLLALGAAPAIVRRAGGPPLVETAIDLDASRGAGSALPLMVALMVDALLGVRLLEQTAAVVRGRAAVQVVPSTGAAGAATPVAPTPVPAPPAAPPARELCAWFALAAAIVLAWEIARLSSRLRARTSPGGGRT